MSSPLLFPLAALTALRHALASSLAPATTRSRLRLRRIKR